MKNAVVYIAPSFQRKLHMHLNSRMRMKIAENLPILAVIAALGVSFAIMAGNFQSSSEPTASTELVISDLSAPTMKGKAAFDANCLACHGSDATGSEMGPPLIHKIQSGAL